MWSKLSEEDRAPYQKVSSEERERVAKELERYKLEGIDISGTTNKPVDPNALIFPMARMKKICKLDPDVKGISKEALLLITKCAELATAKLGKEVCKVAQLQNRRKLLPEDVAQVCSNREQFFFLREDVKDLLRAQASERKQPETKSNTADAAAANSKPLTAYFEKKPSA